jgi:hypothetical protein
MPRCSKSLRLLKAVLLLLYALADPVPAAAQGGTVCTAAMTPADLTTFSGGNTFLPVPAGKDSPCIAPCVCRSSFSTGPASNTRIATLQVRRDRGRKEYSRLHSEAVSKAAKWAYVHKDAWTPRTFYYMTDGINGVGAMHMVIFYRRKTYTASVPLYRPERESMIFLLDVLLRAAYPKS